MIDIHKHLKGFNMENNNGYTEYGYRGLEEIKQLLHDNQILAQNVYDLQKQLQESYKKIKELIDSYSCQL